MATTNIIKINAAFLAAIAKVHSASFARIVYIGEEKLPQKLGLNGQVTKKVVSDVQLNYSYENAVNNRLKSIGEVRTFEAMPLPWGKWLIVNKVIEHNGALYLRAYNYVGAKTETTYYIDGREATEDETALIKAYKAARRQPSKRQNDAGLAEHQVTPFAIKVENVISIKCGECQYIKPCETESESIKIKVGA